MTVEELELRIEKKEKEIARMEKNLVKYIVDDEFTAICDRFFNSGRTDRSELDAWRKKNGYWCLPDYYCKRYDLEEAKETLAKYHKQLENEKAKSSTISEMPEVVVQFREELIKHWDEFDQWKRKSIKEDYHRYCQGVSLQEYRENVIKMREKWGLGYHEFMFISDEQIHKANVNAANTLVLNLIERTVAYAGKIIDCKGLHLDRDNSGFAIINGLVIGEKGKARVESIGAGGYNIQRYHIRVLVKEVK